MAEEAEENYADPTIKLPITTSLEACKTKFFAGDREGFIAELVSGKFKLYSSIYKYSDDYDGRPYFVVNNLLNGFVRQLEDKRKYFFTAFRCQKTDDKYTITGYWITNCTLTMAEIIPDKYEDFDWTEIQPIDDNYKMFIELFFNTDAEGLTVTYLH